MTKERPILFSAPMVRAILDGSKTQTRRVVKLWNGPKEPSNKPIPADVSYLPDFTCYRTTCPYGQPGDRLWVRESFIAYGRWETRFSGKKGRSEWHFIDMTTECDRLYQYDTRLITPVGGRNTVPAWRKRPSIHMARWASRITLEITGVRVERLQDISEADCISEGTPGGPGAIPGYGYNATPFEHYRQVWLSLNGPGSWDANPWVWVVEFKQIEAQAIRRAA